MVGLYATIAYSVSRRTAEIGVRMALGASRTRACCVSVLTDAALLAGIGIAIGLGARGLRDAAPRRVPGGRPQRGRSATFTATALLLLGVSVAAAGSPARRAMRIDPVAALRRE